MFNRAFSFGMRQPLRNLTDEEAQIIKKEIDRIEADASVFIIDTKKPRKTLYDEISDKVYVGSNVFPDLENPSNMTDKLSVACVLAHEYYGHRSMRSEYLNEDTDTSMTMLDEFKASFLAYKNTPNLTNEEREMLLYQAYETAKEGNLEEEIKMCKEIIKQFSENAFKDTKDKK